MTCVHLRQLHQLCKDNDLRFTGSDLVHFVCQQCGEQEVCPSTLMDEIDDESDDSEPAAADES